MSRDKFIFLPLGELTGNLAIDPHNVMRYKRP